MPSVLPPLCTLTGHTVTVPATGILPSASPAQSAQASLPYGSALLPCSLSPVSCAQFSLPHCAVHFTPCAPGWAPDHCHFGFVPHQLRMRSPGHPSLLSASGPTVPYSFHSPLPRPLSTSVPKALGSVWDAVEMSPPTLSDFCGGLCPLRCPGTVRP